MEGVLRKIRADPLCKFNPELIQMCDEALELLADDDGTEAAHVAHVAPAFRLRERCFLPFKSAFNSRSEMLIQLAIEGIQLMWHDDRFHSNMAAEIPAMWVGVQIIDAVENLPNLPENMQFLALDMLQRLVYTTVYALNIRVILDLYVLCRDAFISTDTYSLKVKSQAVVESALQGFAETLGGREGDKGQLGNEEMADIFGWNSNATEALVVDTVEIIRFVLKDVAEGVALSVSGNSAPAAKKAILRFALDAILCFLAKISPSSALTVGTFQDLVWQQLCPQLVDALGKPIPPDRHQDIAKSLSPMINGSSEIIPDHHQKTFCSVYQITLELLRLIGGVESLRPVLQALLHRILYMSPITQRCEALTVFSKVFEDASQLSLIAGPAMVMDSDKREKAADTPGAQLDPLADISIIKVMLDAAADFTQHCKSDSGLEVHCHESTVPCVEKLLHLLSSLLDGDSGAFISDKRVMQLKNFYISSVSDTITSISQKDTNTSSSVAEKDKETCEIIEDDDVFNDEVFVTQKVERHLSLCKSDDVASELGLSASAYVARDSTSSEGGLSIIHDGLTLNHASQLVNDLTSLIPKLNCLTAFSDIDDSLMQFSTSFCETVLNDSAADHLSVTIVNADGIYLLCCYSLKFFNELDEYSMTKEDFQRFIFEGGALVYLSKSWICNVYDFLFKQYHSKHSFSDCMKKFLGSGDKQLSPKDLEQGTENNLENESDRKKVTIALVKRILRTCHGPIIQILSKAAQGWRPADALDRRSTLFSIPCHPLCPKELLLQARSISQRASRCFGLLLDLSHSLDQDAVIAMSLKSLSEICCLQPKASLVNLKKETVSSSPSKAKDANKEGNFHHNALRLLERRLPENVSRALHVTSIQREIQQVEKEEQDQARKRQQLFSEIQAKHLHCFHASPVFSFSILLDSASKFGGRYPQIWGSVIKAYLHLYKVEHHFCSINDSNKADATLSSQRIASGLSESLLRKIDSNPMALSCDSSVPIKALSDEITSSCGPDALNHPDVGGCLPRSQTSLLLSYFSSYFDIIFEDVVKTYSAEALFDYFKQIGSCLQDTLAVSKTTCSVLNQRQTTVSCSRFLLQRLSDSILNICQSENYPFYTILKCWDLTHPFLLNAASHSEPAVSHLAVETLYKVVSSMIVRIREKKYFHLHEAFLKPFENILCLDLCETATQDHVLNVLCTLVEGYTEELGSGWRPLFSALRHIHLRFSECESSYTQSVLDIFQVFFGTDDMNVFANAALDVILVILKFLRGGGASNGEDTPATNKDPYYDSEDESDNEGFDSAEENELPAVGVNSLCIPAFGYLKATAETFSSMFRMLDCPTFPAANWIKLTDTPQKIDSNLPHVDHDVYQKFSIPLTEAEIFLPNPQERKDNTSNPLRNDALNRLREVPSFSEYPVTVTRDSGEQHNASDTITDMDPGSGILHVWFLLIEGVASTITSCPQAVQPQAMQLLFDMVTDLGDCPGPKFGIYCINTLLLPTLQMWLRRDLLTGKSDFMDMNLSNFKQCFGLATTLVTHYILRFSSLETEHKSLTFMLQQFFDVLIEGISIPNESIARLSCSCIKHLVLRTNATTQFVDEMWDVTCKSLNRACHVSLYPLKRLMTCFKEGSDKFYGDARHVRVGARKISAIKANHLKQLALQVFQVESQQLAHLCPPEALPMEESPLLFSVDEKRRAFVFLLFDYLNQNLDQDGVKNQPGNESGNIPSGDPNESIEFKQIIFGLMTHQLLTQTVGALLLHGSARVMESEEKILGIEASLCCFGNEFQRDSSEGSTGFLSQMSTKNVHLLLDTLEESFNFAHDFDARPGLKILLQNVVQGPVALNLYQTSSVCFLLYYHTLLELSLNAHCLIGHGNNKKQQMRFRKGIKEFCQLYIDFQLDRFGHNYMIDALAKKPMYLLLAKFDEIPEFPLKLPQNKDEKDEAMDRSSNSRKPAISPVSIYTPATESDVNNLRKQFVLKKKSCAMPPIPRIKDDPCQAAGTLPVSTFPSNLTSSPVAASSLTVGISPASSSSSHSGRQSPMKVASSSLSPQLPCRSSAAGRSRRYRALSPLISSAVNLTTMRNENQELGHEIDMSEKESIDQKIEAACKKSLKNDYEARHDSFVAVLMVIFDLLINKTSDEEFQHLVPHVFETANQLVAHATDSKLRQTVSKWFEKLGQVYNLQLPDEDDELKFAGKK